MFKVVLLIGLVCALAPGPTDAGFWSSLVGAPAEVDFKDFDYWLQKGLPNNEDPQANLDYVNNNKGQLKSAAVSHSAKIFAAFLGATECNGDLLMYARDLRRNNVDLDGPLRYQKLMRSTLERVFKLCSEYVGSELKSEYDSKLENTLVPWFLEVVVARPHGWEAPNGRDLSSEPTRNFYSYTLDPRNFDLGPEAIDWRNYLEDLAEDDARSTVYQWVWDPNTQDQEKVFHEENFKYIYEKYIIKPCATLKGLADTFKGVYAMSELQPTANLASARKLTSANRGLVLQLMYGFKVCQDFDSQYKHITRFVSEQIQLGLERRHRRRGDKLPTA